MNCSEVYERLGIYWDLPADDPLRIHIDQHLQHCSSCVEEFRMWQESMGLIHAIVDPSQRLHEVTSPHIAGGVMSRIYADELWRIPISERVYSISKPLRRNLTIVIALCLTLFMFSSLYSIMYEESPVATEVHDESSTVLPVMDETIELLTSGNHVIEGVAIASLSNPLVLKMGSFQTYPDYLLAVSLLGLVGSLLMMNWFSRIRA